MNDKTLTKLKKLMEKGAKSIALGDKAIEAIKETQAKVVEDFTTEVQVVVAKSKETIAIHQEIIQQAEGMTL